MATTNKTSSTTKHKESPAAEPVKQVAEEPKKIVARDIDPHMLVNVRNGFQGKLVYVSKRTGEVYIWDSFGDDQEMELQELKNAKTSCKRFFMDNWFMFDDDWVIDYLGVRNMYQYALDLDSFDSIFENDPEKIEEEISVLSNGQKNSLAYRARQMIADGKIDSRKAIAALEKALNTELVEH